MREGEKLRDGKMRWDYKLGKEVGRRIGIGACEMDEREKVGELKIKRWRLGVDNMLIRHDNT